MTGGRTGGRPARRPAGRRPRRGTSLVEVAVSSLVISIMLVAVLRTVGATASAGAAADERTRAIELAEQLLAEIRTRAYADPDGAATALGVDAGESPTRRAGWDDVDDYHDWSATPPVDADGEPVPDAAGWTRRVRVDHADRADPRVTAAGETGLKRITVGVDRDGRLVVRRHAIVSAAGRPTGPPVPGQVDGPGPRAVVVAPGRRGPAPIEVTFDAHGSADPRGGGLSGTWDFGDGAAGSGLKVAHVYEKPGRYVASLRVTDELGRVDVASVLVVVEAP